MRLSTNGILERTSIEESLHPETLESRYPNNQHSGIGR